MTNYYLVFCKCGHVGRNKYRLVSFPIEAESAKEAAKIARSKPRVKHNHKDAVRSVVRISAEDFCHQQKINEFDPYLKCKNKKEQNLLGQLSNIFDDEHAEQLRYLKHERIVKSLYLKKQKVKVFSFYKKNFIYSKEKRIDKFISV